MREVEYKKKSSKNEALRWSKLLWIWLSNVTSVLPQNYVVPQYSQNIRAICDMGGSTNNYKRSLV